jgi:hypothetical protein
LKLCTDKETRKIFSYFKSAVDLVSDGNLEILKQAVSAWDWIITGLKDKVVC